MFVAPVDVKKTLKLSAGCMLFNDLFRIYRQLETAALGDLYVLLFISKCCNPRSLMEIASNAGI